MLLSQVLSVPVRKALEVSQWDQAHLAQPSDSPHSPPGRPLDSPIPCRFLQGWPWLFSICTLPIRQDSGHVRKTPHAAGKRPPPGQGLTSLGSAAPPRRHGNARDVKSAGILGVARFTPVMRGRGGVMWAKTVLTVFQMSRRPSRRFRRTDRGTRMKPHWRGGEENLLSFMFKKKNNIRGLYLWNTLTTWSPNHPLFLLGIRQAFFPSLPCNELWSCD